MRERDGIGHSAIVKRCLWALVLGLSLCVAQPASAAQQISWDDLTIPVNPKDDPYYGLTPEQSDTLFTLFEIDFKRLEGEPILPQDIEDEQIALAILDETGIDGKALVAQERDFRKKLEAQQTSIRPEWDGKDVRIPGYLLPLEFDGTRVTEFVLVPYVGACIHTPPPPANQMILVSAPEGVESRGLFTPVWVEGRIAVDPSSQSVGLSDGTATFDVSYALEASEVVDYE